VVSANKKDKNTNEIFLDHLSTTVSSSQVCV